MKNEWSVVVNGENKSILVPNVTFDLFASDGDGDEIVINEVVTRSADNCVCCGLIRCFKLVEMYWDLIR